MKFLDILRAVLRSPDVVAAVGAAMREARKQSVLDARATASAIKRTAESTRLALREYRG